MKVAVLKETRSGERRVALVPAGVQALVKLGLDVTVETGAGTASGVADAAYVEQCRVTNEVWRDWLAARAAEAGLACTRSHGNFLLADCGARVDAADAHLRAHGIIVRRMGGYGLPGHLRISIGTEADCRAVAEAFSTLEPAR